ncbi:MAG: MotA/TolQ/ExbB proton channel family protein [Planctomycetes bacterium]|nr:MotA/TolQ/ExbB proton channel family protein [Planctomycetota bacterium]
MKSFCTQSSVRPARAAVAVHRTAVAATGPALTLLQQIQNGGVVGYLIIGLSVVALALAIIHFLSIRPQRLLPPHVISQLEDLLGRRDVKAAIEACQRPENQCFLSRIMERGLSRYARTAFGPFEFKEALERAGADQVARLYRATDALGLIGAIAPMLGLLGTVIGMVGAFDTISQADTRPELLAGNISQALVTTLMGLLLAIPTMAAFTYFRNRIDHYAAEAAQQIEQLIEPIEPAGHPTPGAAAGATPARAAGGGPAPKRAAPQPTAPTAGAAGGPAK